MNLRTERVQGYINKILVSRTGFKIGTKLKINLNERKDRSEVKSKEAEMVKTEPDVKQKGKEIVKTKPYIKPNKEHKQDFKPNIRFDRESEPDTYEEEKVALVLGITSVFTVWWMFK